jgi:tRNA pseudouridine55 synthase
MLGEQDQVPPVYSAVKIGGKRACDLARKGKPPTLKSRKINIFSLDLVNFNGNEASFVVECSGGTYVRSLAVDIAKKLGTECFVTKIHRTVDRIFKIDDSFSLDFLRKISHKCTIGNLLVPVGKVLGGIPEVPVSVQVLEDVNAGRPFLVCEEAAGCSCSVYDGMVQILCNECVVGLGVIRDGMCFPKRVLNVF